MRKLYTLFTIVFLLSIGFLSSCSSDDGGAGGVNQQPTVTGVNLTASSQSSSLGDPIIFTVTTNTGENVTNQAEISVNGNAISGATFNPTTQGSYTVRATYQSFTSNLLTVNFIKPYETIALTVDNNDVEVGDRVNFSVIADGTDDVTNDASILVNGTSISGSSYTPDSEGTFTATASLGSLNSNDIEFTATYPDISALFVDVNVNEAFWGDIVNLTVTDNFNRNLSNEATIFVNGIEHNGTTITADEDASFDIYATYENVNSNTVTVTFSEPPPTYVKNVLLEDYQGTWCQFCPRVSYAIELLEEQTDDVVVVGIHVNDEMDRVNTSSLRNTIGVNSYPTAKIDRINDWNLPESENLNQILAIAGREEFVGLAIESSLSGNTISTEVKVAFSSTYDADLELVVYLVEDGLLYDQINAYDNLYGGQNPIPDFEHNGVLSDVFTNILGDDIPSSDTQRGGEYVRSFSTNVPGDIEDVSNLQVVAFVIDASTNQTINSRKGAINTTADYQFYE